MLSCIRHGVMLWGPDRRLIASNAIAAELLDLPPGLLTPGRTQDEILDNMLARGHFGTDENARKRALELLRRATDSVLPEADQLPRPAACSTSAPTRPRAVAGSPPSPT